MIKNTVRIIVIGLLFSACASLQANNLSKLYDRVNPSVVVIKILEQSISEKRFGEIITQADLGSTKFILDLQTAVFDLAYYVHVFKQPLNILLPASGNRIPFNRSTTNPSITSMRIRACESTQSLPRNWDVSI